MEIPEFLYKLNGTFFKKATAKERRDRRPSIDSKLEVEEISPKKNSLQISHSSSPSIPSEGKSNRRPSFVRHQPNPQPSFVNNSETEETICQICFDKAPDSVFMECGHGGVCFNCALDVWRNSEECYLCRARIEQILQLDCEQVNSDRYYKIIASTRLIEEGEEAEIQGDGDYEIIV